MLAAVNDSESGSGMAGPGWEPGALQSRGRVCWMSYASRKARIRSVTVRPSLAGRGLQKWVYLTMSMSP